MAGRFIKLYDKILQWEWFGHPNTVCLFIYLLLKANYKDTRFQGKVIQRGQLLTSIPKLATDTGLSIQQTKTAMNHLRLTGEVTDEANRQYRIITVVKYDEYQSSTDKTTNNQPTNNRQSNRQITDNLTPCIEYIEQKEGIEQIENTSLTGSKKTNTKITSSDRQAAARFVKPTREEVRRYCIARRNDVDWDKFYDFYEANGWKVGKVPMKDWKASVRYWETEYWDPKKKQMVQKGGKRDGKPE